MMPNFPEPGDAANEHRSHVSLASEGAPQFGHLFSPKRLSAVLIADLDR
jgi:hypothetical protein